jgi:hypothetical protein
MASQSMMTEKAKQFIQRCVPGALVIRDRDKHVGMIVIAQRPKWDDNKNEAGNWSFEILIDNTLVMTDRFASTYSVV